MRFPNLREKDVFNVGQPGSAWSIRAMRLSLLWLAASLLLGSPAMAQNKVLKLDGRDSYVELPTNIFNHLTQATVEVWVKWESFRSYSRVFEFGAPWQSMSLFNHANTPDLRFNLYPKNAQHDPSLLYHVRAPGLLRSNEWIHLAAVSGSRLGMKLYANGVLVGSHSNAASFANLKVFHTNFLGRGLVRNPTDRDFRGEIDEFRVWDHRRNTAQIRENMFKRLSGNEPGLELLCNFDDGTANDASPNAHHGKLVGNAKVVGAELGFSTPVAAPPPPAALAAGGGSTNASAGNVPVVTPSMPTPAAAPVTAVTLPAARDSGLATWWIAGALSLIVALLACLVFLLGRSGINPPKLISHSAAAPLSVTRPNSNPNSAIAPSPEVKERALAELTDFAKQSLVQGLYSQKVALLEAQKKAQQELAELEERLVALHLPDRIQAYEKRIAELESELGTRNDELHELTRATLLLLRQKLEEEKQSDTKTHRLN